MINISAKEYNAILTAHKIFALYESRNKQLRAYLKANCNWREVILLVIEMAKQDLQNGGHELAKQFLQNVYFTTMNHKLAYSLAVETFG